MCRCMLVCLCRGKIMIITTSSVSKTEQLLDKPIHYGDIVARLELAVPSEYSQKAVERMARLDAALGFVSKKIDIITVCGSNGKSLAINFASRLFKEEGVVAGECYSSHVLSYNERLCVNQHSVNNKVFAEAVYSVFAACDQEGIDATAFEITTMAALMHFVQEGLSVALVEVAHGGCFDATAAFDAKLVAITRVAQDDPEIVGSDLDVVACDMVSMARQGTWVISAEQSKLRLQKMKECAETKNINWAMPLRKLSSLPYVYEQLYGRTASLGERIAQLYFEKVKNIYSPLLHGSGVSVRQGQRGRPTLEAKRQALLNPVKTLKAFWSEHFGLLRGRFELLDKEKPTVLLDSADNLDAFLNLFLGVRLLHYQRPIKGLVLIVGLVASVDAEQVLRNIRYLLRKVQGSVIFIDLPAGENCHSALALEQKATQLGFKTQSAHSLKEAFDHAKALVDDRHGLVTITGSIRMVATYWRTVRDIKRF